MGVRIHIITLTVAVGIASSCVVSADDESTTKAMEAQYARRSRIMSHGDVQAMADTLTPDFCEIDIDGTVHKGKGSILKAVEYARDLSDVTHTATYKILHLRSRAREILVTNLFTVAVTGSHPTIVKDWLRETWIRTPQGWRCKVIRHIATRITIDGRLRKNQGTIPQ
jgi:ketosteroid isomerase-like protein